MTRASMDMRVPSRWVGVVLLAGLAAAFVTAGCTPMSGGDTAQLTIREAWPSPEATAHRRAALIVVRVDGHGIFRRFAPLSDRSFYSSDEAGGYQIAAAFYRCAGLCREGGAPTRVDRVIARCSLHVDFDGTRSRSYVLVFRHTPTSCTVAREPL
jgi:hypothetical protein